ncbi:class I SAM-dependent methyltransferase [Salinimicrobium sp. CDJ15-81-2]|nr:class I SAM-dependent methyltransferase [Salinimicrobium nanhaiense]
MQPLNFSEDPVLICKDHTVSGEYFELRKAEALDLLATFPRPENDKLSEYYKSENYISHTDSKRSFLDKVYQKVKNLMLQKKINWIEKSHSGKGRILDIGAGTGDFLVAAKNAGWETLGLEPNLGARKLAAKKGVELIEDIYSLPDSHFDVITMWHVLEHVPDLDWQLKELDRILKPDGLLVIAVPNYKSYDAQKYKEHWAAYDVPRHLYHFSPEAMRKIFQQKGFLLTSQKGLFFDAFYVSLLSEKYKTGSSNPLKAITTGILSNIKAASSGNYSSLAYFFRRS